MEERILKLFLFTSFARLFLPAATLSPGKIDLSESSALAGVMKR
jgi:hypothetical protein